MWSTVRCRRHRIGQVDNCMREMRRVRGKRSGCGGRRTAHHLHHPRAIGTHAGRCCIALPWTSGRARSTGGHGASRRCGGCLGGGCLGGGGLGDCGFGGRGFGGRALGGGTLGRAWCTRALDALRWPASADARSLACTWCRQAWRGILSGGEWAGRSRCTGYSSEHHSVTGSRRHPYGSWPCRLRQHRLRRSNLAHADRPVERRDGHALVVQGQLHVGILLVHFHVVTVVQHRCSNSACVGQ